MYKFILFNWNLRQSSFGENCHLHHFLQLQLELKIATFYTYYTKRDNFNNINEIKLVT